MRSPCLAVSVATETRSFVDLVAGPQSCNVASELGNFVIAKADGAPAYQLAVVVDDHAMGITEVLRGDDLLPSAFRQLELYDFFGWQPPQFAHVPLVVGRTAAAWQNATATRGFPLCVPRACHRSFGRSLGLVLRIHSKAE